MSLEVEHRCKSAGETRGVRVAVSITSLASSATCTSVIPIAVGYRMYSRLWPVWRDERCLRSRQRTCFGLPPSHFTPGTAVTSHWAALEIAASSHGEHRLTSYEYDILHCYVLSITVCSIMANILFGAFPPYSSIMTSWKSPPQPGLQPPVPACLA